MKSELIYVSEIDWSKPQLVRYEDTDGIFVVLTAGRHNGAHFEGVVVWSEHPICTVGHYNNLCLKDSYTVLPSTTAVKLQND